MVPCGLEMQDSPNGLVPLFVFFAGQLAFGFFLASCLVSPGDMRAVCSQSNTFRHDVVDPQVFPRARIRPALAAFRGLWII